MAQLPFQLDDDLVDAFVRLQQAGHEYTLDTILLIQVLRRLEALQISAPEEHDPGNGGLELVPSATPAPRPNPQAQAMVDSIRQPNQALMHDLEAEAAEPIPAADPPEQTQPAAPSNSQPAPRPAPRPTAKPIPVARPVQSN